MANTIRTSGFTALIDTLVSKRESIGMNQRELARRLGCSQGTINRIETGQRRIDVIELVVLARALDLDPRDLFDLVVRKISDDELIANFSTAGRAQREREK